MSGMHAMRAAARHFLRERWRERRLPAALALLLAMSLCAIALTGLRIQDYERQRLSAQRADRATWLAQGPRNPHSVAHFSRFAFKPAGPGLLLDPGITDYLGSAVWLEAHWQRPANFRGADDRIDLGRFAELNLAWVWQVLGTLAIVVLGFDAVARERERGTLAMLRGNGVGAAPLIIGMALGLSAALLGTLLCAFCVAQAVAWWLFPGLSGDQWLRALLWLLAHGGFLVVIACIVVAMSARLRGTQTALASLLALWVLAVLLWPRFTINAAESARPVPTAAEFWLSVTRDIEQGFDGRSPAHVRARALKERTLARYGVADVSQLPVSYAALALQEDEQYANAVFDRRFAALEAGHRKQARWHGGLGMLSPLVGVQAVSAGVAAGDAAHHLDFTRQVEAQRRVLIARLNDDMIRHGAGLDYEYLAPADFWASLPDPQYRAPALAASAAGYGAAAATLIAWLALAALLLRRAVRRVDGGLRP